MATPAEIVKRWDDRLAREASAARAKSTVANDNRPREPDGHLIVDGQPMAFWLPAGAAVVEKERVSA